MHAGNRSHNIVSLFVVLVITLLGSGFGLATRPAHAAATTEVVVHYYRPAADYKGWNLWIWPTQPAGGDGAEYDFNGADDFGKVADVQVPGADTQVGIIARLNNWDAKDVSQDRFINISGSKAEVWLVEGDAKIYTSLADAKGALKPQFFAAFLDSANVVTASFNRPVSSAAPGDFTVTDTTTNQQIAVTGVQAAAQGTGSLLTLTLASQPKVTDVLQVTYNGANISTEPRSVLDDKAYFYGGSDLGAIYHKTYTTFRVWSPTATSMVLNIFKNANGDLFKNLQMKRSKNGTWYAKVKANLKNMYYLYGVNHGSLAGTAVDPYAVNSAVNGKWGQIADLAATNPKGWNKDHFVVTKSPEDASIYEVHARDFSIDPNSGMKHRGKYLAFTETGTKGPGGVSTGVDSLKQLGVTHVELLPTQGCGSIDEVAGEKTTVAAPGSNQYNWCYDPTLYDVRNGAYATKATGATRITEFKQMVEALHKQHLGVILDVVYNHTSGIVNSNFDQLVPQYYYRTDSHGQYTNGTGVGNEIAAERPMVRKLILDSVAYLMKQYHVDGFRFDEMATLGTGTVTALQAEIRKIDPSAIMLGEPWGGGTSGLTTDTMFDKTQTKGTHVAVFNDNIRDAVAGSAGTATSQGYATGDPQSFTSLVPGIAGSVNFSASVFSFAQNPDETINYVSCHDNYTLWDHIASSNPSVSEADRIKMDELAQTAVFTAQGIPYMQGGEEFLRTKQGNGNSYNAGDAINQFDWSRKSQYISVFNYYAGLIHLRRNHPAFRMMTAAMIQQHLRYLNAPDNVINFQLTDNANGDKWNNIEVILNPNATAEDVALPSGTFTIVAQNGQIGETSLGSATGSVSVSPYTTTILYGGDPGTAIDPMAGTGSTKPVAVSFRVKVPSNTPAGDTVYISGNVPQLGPWDAGHQKMTDAGNGIWTVTLSLPDKLKLQYKYTRGTWATVESWGTIAGLANRNVRVDYGTDGTQTVNDTATDWGQPGPDDHRAVQQWADLPLP